MESPGSSALPWNAPPASSASQALRVGWLGIVCGTGLVLGFGLGFLWCWACRAEGAGGRGPAVTGWDITALQRDRTPGVPQIPVKPHFHGDIPTRAQQIQFLPCLTQEMPCTANTGTWIPALGEAEAEDSKSRIVRMSWLHSQFFSAAVTDNNGIIN